MRLEVKLVDLDGRQCLGLVLDLGGAPLVIVRARRGYAACGYLNREVAEKLGDTVVVVTGVRSVEEMLDKPVAWASSKARELGVKPGMKCREALKRMS